MSDAAEQTSGECYAVRYVPTLAGKFWRALGFRHHHGDDPEDIDKLEGWSQTVVHFRFGFLDRLRLLLTGRFKVTITSSYDAPSPSIIKNRTDYRIIEPFGKWL